jgi:hypothetical protein
MVANRDQVLLRVVVRNTHGKRLDPYISLAGKKLQHSVAVEPFLYGLARGVSSCVTMQRRMVRRIP